MKELRKHLAYHYPPVIDTFSGVAGNVSVLMLNPSNKFLIFKNHYLLTYYMDSNSPGFNWLYYDDSFKNAIDIRKDITEESMCGYIKECIESGFYVHLFLDHFYLPFVDEFKQNHKIHDAATVFGYDDFKSTFLVGDNYRDGKYWIQEINYDDFIKARKNILNTPAEKFKILNNNVNGDKELAITLLKSYLDGKCYLKSDYIDPVYKNTKEANTLWGMALYDVLIKQVDDFEQDKQIDIRTFHILINHMNLYSYLIEQFIENKNLLDEAGWLVKKAIENRNLFLKYSMTYKEKEKLIQKMIELRKAEFLYITKILEII